MAHMKKAEKSRVHAKQRRVEEAKEITEIAELLPLPTNVTKRLDKASILRLAITFLRLKQFVGEDKNVSFGLDQEVGEGNLMLESLSGFFIIISAQEEIIFVSENVEKHMGLKQIDLLGKNIYDFIFEKDKSELQKQFNNKYQDSNIHGVGYDKHGQVMEMNLKCTTVTDTSPVLEQHRQFFLRMKCSYQRRNSVIKSHTTLSVQNDYTLLQWTGYLHYDSEGHVTFLAAVARPLQPTPIMELKMDGNMFISRHSLDMRFMYCDPRLSTMLGYEPDEISGNSMYQFHHPGDLEMCGNCHSNLMTAGTSISKYYRFLSKANEWCWLQTRATIVYNTAKNPQYIVCMNYIVSEKEGRRYLMEHLDNSADTQHSSTTMKASTPNTSPLSQQHNAAPSVIQNQPNHDSVMVNSIMSDMSGIQLSEGAAQHPHHFYPSEAEQAQVTSTDDNDSTGCYSDQQPHNSPTFYLPHDKQEPLLQVKQDDGLALGNLWLSVHSMIDPSNQYQSEIIPPSLAEEMEEISFSHCQRLMSHATKAAVGMYSNETFDLQPAMDWDRCERLVDAQAINMFQRFKDTDDAPIRHSHSSSSLSSELVVGTPSISSSQTSYMASRSQGNSSHSSTEHTPTSQLIRAGESSGFVSEPTVSSAQQLGGSVDLDACEQLVDESALNDQLLAQHYLGSYAQLPSQNFGELANIEDLFQNYPELYNRSAMVESPPLRLPMGPPESSAQAQPTPLTFMSLMSDQPPTTDVLSQPVRRSASSQMSLSSNISQDSLHRIVSLASEMDFSTTHPGCAP